MRHSIARRVSFGHADPARIVFYPRFFEWFHEAFEQMFEPICGKTYAEVLDVHGVGYPAVQIACEYRAPARFGDLVTIEVFLSRLGERSATFEYRVRKDGVLLAAASIKVAGMDMRRQVAAPFPDEVRRAFAPYVESVEDPERPSPGRIWAYPTAGDVPV
jgi:YbgC/YbaW family acyl-CoA thioester hydrolase